MNWADVDEEDEEGESSSPTAQSRARFETAADAHGIKTVIEYKERDGKTFKVTRKVRVTKVTKWYNEEMTQRKSMEKFGKAKITSEGIGAQRLSQPEDGQFDLCKKAVVLAQSDNAEDKFLEDALKGCENLFKEKKVWTDMNRATQMERETDTAPAANTTDTTAADAGNKEEASKKYVPPSVKAAMEQGKGGGKGNFAQEQEASLRVTNLSEICEENTLRELFSTCGRLQRVYLAKDESRTFCKGFAFVTYERKEMAEKAIKKLNGHGLDNLIMQVQWAKPRT
jgi:translation initiation factor 3 subunit G